MKEPPEILFSVTNDLNYDQRMQRICTSLAAAGYKVTLIGREMPGSLPLEKLSFNQHRIKCRYNSGKAFYLEYNWRLYCFLKKYTSSKNTNIALCAIDLDTILPVLAVSKARNIPRVYDAHELFTELIEVKRRKTIAFLWKWVEKTAVPNFKKGYTVNEFIAGEFKRRYQVAYKVVRNMPFRKTHIADPGQQISGLPTGKFFLYQGAVNEGRSFETLLPAMKQVNAPLVIAGKGNFYDAAVEMVKLHQLQHKVFFLGYLKPSELAALTPKAYAGITIFENNGLNQYYSLANRYFDYIQGGIPQLCVDYPEYRALNEQFPAALLISNLSADSIAAALNKLLMDDVLYRKLKFACTVAAETLCWEQESGKLTAFWKEVLPIKYNVEQ